MDTATLQQLLAPLFPGLMGLELTATSPERVQATLRVRPDLCTAGGILHGGAYMAFADTIGAVATVLNLPAGAGTTTVESKTNFISAIRAGEVARAECTPVHRGKTTQVWTTRILRPDGKLAAIVTQTQMVLAARAKA